MLQFSEYLRELMNARKLTVSALARASGVERTQLSKVLAGQRVLPYHMLDQLIYYMQLDPREEKRLRARYDAQFESAQTRRDRERIDRMLRDLARLDLDQRPVQQTRLLTDLEQYAAGRVIFTGQTNVMLLVRMAIVEEMVRPDACVDTTALPVGDSMQADLIRWYMQEGTRMKIRHVLCFDANTAQKDGSPGNLELLCQILPVCLVSRERYIPYYYYDNMRGAQYTDPFPNFLVTHSCVVCLAEDMSSAMLLRDPEAVRFYRRHFETMLDPAYELVRYIDEPLQMLRTYQQWVDMDGIYVAMDQPCFGRFYSQELTQAHLRHGVPGEEQLLELALNRFRHFRQVPRFYTFFSEAGLRRFMKDGTLDDYPVELVSPFSVEERRWLLEKLMGEIRSGETTGRVFREGVFPEYLSVVTTSQQGIGIFTTGQFPLNGSLCSIQIREPNLTRAFHNWMTSLPGSNLTMTAQETLEIMERVLKDFT